MKRLGILTSIMFCIVVTSSVARAAFLFEPYVGYNFSGKEKMDTTVIGDTETDMTGLGFGARMGLSIMGLMAGLDYTVLDLEDSDDSDNTSNITNIGAFVGYQFPLRLRLWAAYFLKSESENKEEMKAEGTGFKVGLGYMPIRFLSINLEMIQITIDEGDATLDAMLGDFEIKNTTYMFSISFPIDI